MGVEWGSDNHLVAIMASLDFYAVIQKQDSTFFLLYAVEWLQLQPLGGPLNICTVL